MVASKKCKICSALDPDNIPIYGEYLGILLPNLIEKTSGIELDPRKANSVLICELCAIQLVHTSAFISKLQNSLQRLKKLVKETKPKITFKDSKSQARKITDTTTGNEELQIAEKLQAGKIDSQTNPVEPKTLDQSKTQSRKKISLKSGFLDGVKTIPTTTTGELQKNSDEIQNGPKSKTNKNVARRRSVFLDGTNSKFKKILDGDVANASNNQPPAKASKRKLETTGIASTENFNNVNINCSDIVDTTVPVKLKTISSASGDFPMDLTLDEPEFSAFPNEFDIKDNKVKIMNCIICGKTFRQKSALRDHINTSHMGESLKACPHCSSEFRSLQKYESHVYGEKCKNSNHACKYPQCNKRFKTVYKMELHMHEQHSSQNESDAD